MRMTLRALSYFRQDWRLVLVLLGLIGLSTLLGLLAAWPMAILADSVLSDARHADVIHRLLLAPLPQSKVGQIIGLALIGLGLKLVSDLLSTLQTIVTNHINYSGLSRVRCDLYRKLQALHLAFHRSHPQGDVIYRLTSDTFGCQAILGVIISATVALVTLVVMTILLGTRDLTLTLLALSIMPVLATANIVYGRKLSQRSTECREMDARFTTTVQRSISCIGLVQAFGREDDEFSRFTGCVSESVRAWWRLNRQQIAYNLIIGTTFAIGGALVFGYGGYLVHSGKLSIGDLMIFTSYLGMLWGPLCTLTGFASNLQGGVAGAKRVFEVLDRDIHIIDKPGALALPVRPREIQLENLGFSYPASDPVLRDVSATIPAGQMVAFVGESGAGKSTMLSLLPRFFDPTRGAVKFDGIDLRDVKVKDVRKHVALVLQESVVLPVTIAENISYGRPGATPAEVQAAAVAAGASGFIETLPQGYDTVVAEGGANLSGGQRQRLAIARALLTQAPVLVLDEPTSALDANNEQIITDALRDLKGTRTIILVSHRLSTVLDCDQIFLMREGKIAEQGTHEHLMALDGHYADMARSQGLTNTRPIKRPANRPEPQLA